MKTCKNLLAVLILCLSLMLVGCADLIGAMSALSDLQSEMSSGVAVEAGTFYEDYVCAEGSDGTVFEEGNFPSVTIFDGRFEMRIIAADETQFVYGDAEITLEEETYLLNLNVTQSEYENIEPVYILIYDDVANTLTATSQIGMVAPESVYNFYSSGYFEAPFNGGEDTPQEAETPQEGEVPDADTSVPETTPAEETAPPAVPTDATQSPLPDDTQPTLNDLYNYIPMTEELIDYYNPKPRGGYPDITSLILEDWAKGRIMDENFFDSIYNGTYTLTGYYWNSMSQVEQHTARIFDTAPPHIYAQALDFFATNQVSGLSVDCQVIFGADMFLTSGSRTERYFYDDGVENAGVALNYIGGAHEVITLQDAISQSLDGTAIGYIEQSGSDVAIVALEDNYIMAYSTSTDSAGKYENLTLLSLSATVADYTSRQAEPVLLDYSGVSIVTNDTGIRMIGSIDGTSTLVESYI